MGLEIENLQLQVHVLPAAGLGPKLQRVPLDPVVPVPLGRVEAAPVQIEDVTVPAGHEPVGWVEAGPPVDAPMDVMSLEYPCPQAALSPHFADRAPCQYDRLPEVVGVLTQ